MLSLTGRSLQAHSDGKILDGYAADRPRGPMNAPQARALAENPSHLEQLCTVFALGSALEAPARVSGGFHHRMWRLDTPAGRYAVKQIAADLDLRDMATVRRLNATETAARRFADSGIPALVSLARDGQHLRVLDDSGYLVFPWTDSKARGESEIDATHARTVARILARMHRADIRVPGLGRPVTWPLTTARVDELLARAQKHNARDAGYLLQRRNDILTVVQRQDAAGTVLAQQQVVSHGDLDHKNVLWSAVGEPLVIDWESARPLNPTYELLLEALDWSGITANFELAPFDDFLQAYIDAGGVIVGDTLPAAFDAVLGSWVEWLLFNVARAAGVRDLRQRALGSKLVDLSVGALLRLERNSSRITAVAAGYAT